jgi:hypothetical protein
LFDWQIANFVSQQQQLSKCDYIIVKCTSKNLSVAYFYIFRERINGKQMAIILSFKVLSYFYCLADVATRDRGAGGFKSSSEFIL